MQTFETTIGGITATLEVTEEGQTLCTLEKGGKTTSLECAMQEGEWSSDFSKLSDYECDAVDALHAWALKNGY